jgi:hypothetical protein
MTQFGESITRGAALSDRESMVSEAEQRLASPSKLAERSCLFHLNTERWVEIHPALTPVLCILAFDFPLVKRWLVGPAIAHTRHLRRNSTRLINDVFTERDLADAVMDYISEHPNAMDTCKGIAEWWILRRQVRVDVEMLGRVLEQLTEKGLLIKVGSDEQARYYKAE